MKTVADRFAGVRSSLALDEDALRKYPDLIDLSIGDTDIITDRRIIDAAMEDAHRGYTRYGFPQGDPELIDGIRRAWKEDFDQEIDRDSILVTGSSCLGMGELLLAILNPGDEVIVIGPYFGVYRQQIELATGVCREVVTREEDSWGIDEERLRAAVTNRTRAVIFNNPSNPTGVFYSLADMQTLAKVAKEYDLLVLADEIYTRYVFDGKFIPMRTLPGMEERTVTLNSFSKNFMMTGWRVGYIIAIPEIRRATQMVSSGLIYTAPSVSQRAALHALPLRDELQWTVIARYRQRVMDASDMIEKIPYMTLVRPRGTFYLFPGIRGTGLTSSAFCAKALQEAHVLLSPGDAFGEAGRGYFRIACTAAEEKIHEALVRLSSLSFD